MGDDLEQAWIIGNGQPNITFDCVMREAHTSELEVTDNPVDTGVVISDHAFMKALEYDMEGEVSDTPLHGFDQLNGGLLPGGLYTSKASRSASAWDILTGLQKSAEPFGVQSGLKFYPNMVILSLGVDQDVSSEGCLSFRARLREVIRVGTQTVTYPPRKAGKPHRQASKPAAAGEKKTTPVETDPKKNPTLAKQILNGFLSDPGAALSSLAP